MVVVKGWFVLVLIVALSVSNPGRAPAQSRRAQATSVPTATPILPPVEPAPAQASPTPAANTPPLATPVPTPDRVLEYERALQEQDKEFRKFETEKMTAHQTFLDGIYNKLIAIVAILAAAFGATGVAVFASIKRSLRGYFSARIDRLVKKQQSEFEQKLSTDLKRFQETMETNKTTAKEQVTGFQTHIETKIKETQRNADRDFHDLAEFASAISHAAVVLNIKLPDKPEEKARNDKDRLEVIRRLEGLQAKVARHRTFNILLARLFRARGEYTEGIKVLEAVVRNRDDHDLKRDVDYAALLYNLACYRNLQARSQRGPGPETSECRGLRSRAFDDLQRCVTLSPGDYDEAVEEDDLNDLFVEDPNPTDRWAQLRVLAENSRRRSP